MLSWGLLSTSSSALKCMHCGIQQSKKTWASHECYAIDVYVPERVELFKRQYVGESYKAVYSLYVDTLQYRAPIGAEHCWSPSKLTCFLYGWERKRDLPLTQIGMVRKRQNLCLFGWERGRYEALDLYLYPSVSPQTIPRSHTCTRAWVYVRPSQSSCRLKLRPCPVCHFCLNVNLASWTCIRRSVWRRLCMQEDYACKRTLRILGFRHVSLQTYDWVNIMAELRKLACLRCDFWAWRSVFWSSQGCLYLSLALQLVRSAYWVGGCIKILRLNSGPSNSGFRRAFTLSWNG